MKLNVTYIVKRNIFIQTVKQDGKSDPDLQDQFDQFSQNLFRALLVQFSFASWADLDFYLYII